jgi:hypothetical protein
MGVGKDVGDVGCQDNVVAPNILHGNHRLHFQPWKMGIIRDPNLKYP